MMALGHFKLRIVRMYGTTMYFLLSATFQMLQLNDLLLRQNPNCMPETKTPFLQAFFILFLLPSSSSFFHAFPPAPTAACLLCAVALKE